jgi:hypothetical protein
MSDTPSSNAVVSSTANTAASEAVHSSHLEHLTKMSTTAGLGSGDYAAISPLAVSSMVIGLLGALALLNDFLLPVPAAAMVCGIIALRQIRRSNGTQTGKALAWAGVVLGGGIFFSLVGYYVYQEMRNRPDRQAIVQVIRDFDAACAKQDYKAAYQFFSQPFRERVSEDQFVKTLSGSREGVLAQLGSLEHVDWNQQIVFIDSETGPRSAVVGGLLKFQNHNEMSRQPIEFVEVNGKWVIRDLSTIFPPPKKPPPGAPAQPQQAPQ